jgi:hypothetical protein
MNRDIQRLRTMVAEHDPARHVHADRAGTPAVLERILAGAAPTRPARGTRRRWLIAIPLTAVTAVTLVVVSGVLWPGEVGPLNLGSTRALAFTERGDRIEVRIVNPDADPARYRREFAAHGLNVDLRLKAASPSLVGKMYAATVNGENDATQVRQLDAGRGCGRMWCKAGVSIPKNLHGRLILGFGRPPKPGESYELPSPDAMASGEPLAGLKPLGRTVSEVARMAKDRNVTIVRYFAAPAADPKTWSGETWDYNAHILKPNQVPGDWYVHEAFTGHTPNTVELAVSPSPESS